jgi:hypothetical protein
MALMLQALSLKAEVMVVVVVVVVVVLIGVEWKFVLVQQQPSKKQIFIVGSPTKQHSLTAAPTLLFPKPGICIRQPYINCLINK